MDERAEIGERLRIVEYVLTGTKQTTAYTMPK
jgi:hypothetical protein